MSPVSINPDYQRSIVSKNKYVLITFLHLFTFLQSYIIIPVILWIQFEDKSKSVDKQENVSEGSYNNLTLIHTMKPKECIKQV